MSDPAPLTPSPSSGSAARDALVWAAPIMERQMAALDRLVEGGLRLAEAIERQGTTAGSDQPAPVVVQGDVAVAYGRVAKAVRLAILLQSKLIDDRRALEQDAARAAFDDTLRAGRIAAGPEPEDDSVVNRIVVHIDGQDCQDVEQVERMVREAAQGLDRDDIGPDLKSRPTSELVAMICEDLGLEADWPSLAKEPWAKAEMAADMIGDPLVPLMPETIVLQWKDPGPASPAPQAASP